MYYVQKTLTISAAHNLMLSYESKCENLHGHNWVITVYCRAAQLNQDGMVTDFTHINRIVKEKFDHRYINEVLDVNPSAENMARWICDNVENCYKVTVQESEGNMASYERD
ncbi:MAG: 6-carboxytetrahydropterin synthase QueD [Bacteroidales bacterium]|nr:6-carboxytetrahydropterin synthase QueD [Bacteroidales bacterium]